MCSSDLSRVHHDDSGIWKRRNQLLLVDAAALVIVAGALWEGDQTRLGHTYWQSVDSVLIGSASAAALKLAFSRARPTQTDNPNDWFKGHGHQSFPSGEVAAMASAVTLRTRHRGRLLRTQPQIFADGRRVTGRNQRGLEHPILNAGCGDVRPPNPLVETL